MATFSGGSTGWLRVRPFVVSIAVISGLVLLAHWGGTATPGLSFALGIALLIAIIGGMAFVGWWLLLSPLPAKQRIAARQSSAMVRQLLAVFITISGLLFVLGGSWDETWHRLYGVAVLGEDFWWRPHQLIYGSLAINALFALGGMVTIMRGRGTLRQRFRAEPLVGMLTLASGTLILLTPSDVLWHAIYGVDITAWSLPHLVLAIGYTLVILATVVLQLSLISAAGWRSLRGISIQEIFIACALSILMLVLVQFGTAEWEGLERVGVGSAPFFWTRPEWLYPAIIVSLATFIGMIGLHSVKRVGIATLIGVLTLIGRFVILRVFAADQPGVDMTAQSHLLLLPPLIALDLVYAVRRQVTDSNGTLLLAGLAAAGAVLLVDLPIINATMVYPRINGETLPLMIVVTTLMSLAISWVGARIGGALAQVQRVQAETATMQTVEQRTLVFGAATLTVALVVVTVFIVTASPPAPLGG